MGQGRRSPKTQSSGSQSLVTILFVFGIIGWGFFAIDRLTETDPTGRHGGMQGRASGREAGWKKDLRDWLNRKLAANPGPDATQISPTVRNAPRDSQETAVPLLSEPSGLTRDSAGENRPHGEIFLYRLNANGQPVLTRVKRQREHELGNLASYLNEVIRGPNEAETEKDFIDSFIHKPKILHAKTEGRCAVIDFDRKFGSGVSHQTLRFQIRQIFRNIEHLDHLDCLKILILGKYQTHLGVDGIYFPEHIDAAWLKENL